MLFSFWIWLFYWRLRWCCVLTFVWFYLTWVLFCVCLGCLFRFCAGVYLCLLAGRLFFEFMLLFVVTLLFVIYCYCYSICCCLFVDVVLAWIDFDLTEMVVCWFCGISLFIVVVVYLFVFDFGICCLLVAVWLVLSFAFGGWLIVLLKFGIALGCCFIDYLLRYFDVTYLIVRFLRSSVLNCLGYCDLCAFFAVECCLFCFCWFCLVVFFVCLGCLLIVYLLIFGCLLLD